MFSTQTSRIIAAPHTVMTEEVGDPTAARPSAKVHLATKTITEIFTERDRLAVAWSAFFQDYPVIIGPTWADLPFLHDADLDTESGVGTTLQRLQFITPGNLLGIPSVALPMGVVDGLPTGVQVYAERWREDLCLDVASLLESRVGRITPIDPVS